MSSGLHRSHDTVLLSFSNRILYPFFIPFAPNPIHFSESLRLKPIPRPFDFPKFHTAFRFQFLKKYLLEFARAKQINDSPFSPSIFKTWILFFPLKSVSILTPCCKPIPQLYLWSSRPIFFTSILMEAPLAQEEAPFVCSFPETNSGFHF